MDHKRLLVAFNDVVELCAKHDVALVSVAETLDTKTATGEFFVHMLGALAQMERRRIGERTRDALTHKRSQGAAYGTTPYGFQRDGERLVPSVGEQRSLRAMRERRARGESYNRIVNALNERGHSTRCAGTWYAATVHSILNSAMQDGAA